MPYKRMAPRLFALLLPLSLTWMGCGGGNDPAVTPTPTPPPLSSEAGITSLSISIGELSPAFSPTINNYSARCYLGEASMGVTAALKDTKASLTVNGMVAASGARTGVALIEGMNTISVSVVAEDGRTSNNVTLTVNRPAPNTGVWVLNGIAGVPVENTALTLTDNRGKVLADNVGLPREKNGQKIFALDPREKYNIYAKGDNAARACFANYDPAKEGEAALYCLRNYTTFFELEAPVIEEIAFATTDADGADWRVMSNDAYYVGPLADVAAVRVTVLTKNLIAGSTVPSMYSYYAPHVPVGVNIDETASSNTSGATGVTATAVTVNTPVTMPGSGRWYRSVYRCAVPLISTSVFNREHFLDVVVYDCIGNRTEQRVYLTIPSANTFPTEPDLTSTAPVWDVVQAQTFMGVGDLAGRDRDGVGIDAMDPVDPYTGYQQVICQFRVRAPATGTNLPIRGYEVWRSMGNASNLIKIATVNYASPSTGTYGLFQYIDRTPSLVAGDIYYRIRAFTGNPANNGYSPFSASIRAKVMPPTVTGPAISHKMVSDKLWPTFRITASNPLMLNKDTSDHFNFTLFVKYADNPYPFLMVPMQLRFTESEIIGTDPDSDENQHRYGFPVGRPTAVFLNVTGYNSYGSTIYDGDRHYACDATGDEDNPFKPFVYLDDDGSVVINTDSETFRWTMDNAVREAHGNVGDTFLPGTTYLWNLFGASGGVFWNSPDYPAYWNDSTPANAAYFTKGFNANGTTYLGCSYGSHINYGFGSPEGWFSLIIAPDAN